MIYLGADHGGFQLKEELKGYLAQAGYQWQDMGNTVYNPNDDYPDFALPVARAVAKSTSSDKGILLCRTGVGMTIIADKIKGVRAALALSADQIKRARLDEDINMLTIAADYILLNELKEIVKIFLETPFSNEERHRRRLRKIEAIESL